jgi:proteasome lid subunit RPN8/RPN11
MDELVLQREQVAAIERHCEEAYPHEGCGILIGRLDGQRRLVMEVIPTANARQEEDARRRYAIPPEQLLQGELQAEKLGLEVIGYFHSHPDHPARPSDHDLAQAWPGYCYLIVALVQGKAAGLRSWHLLDDRTGFEEEPVVVP